MIGYTEECGTYIVIEQILSNMSDVKKIGLGIIGILAATLVAASIGAFLSNLPEYYHLSKNSVETQGRVVSKGRENHIYISFEYEVNNRKLKLGGRAGALDKDFDEVQLNDKVSVYYDPFAPEDAVLGNPNKRLKSSFVETCIVAVIPILLFAAYKIKSVANG
jgi:Protein of unknown function (DUF3592)